jgi:hypothetical protein
MPARPERDGPPEDRKLMQVVDPVASARVYAAAFMASMTTAPSAATFTHRDIAVAAVRNFLQLMRTKVGTLDDE